MLQTAINFKHQMQNLPALPVINDGIESNFHQQHIIVSYNTRLIER